MAQTLSVSHRLRRFTVSGEVWHFTQRSASRALRYEPRLEGAAAKCSRRDSVYEVDENALAIWARADAGACKERHLEQPGQTSLTPLAGQSQMKVRTACPVAFYPEIAAMVEQRLAGERES